MQTELMELAAKYEGFEDHIEEMDISFLLNMIRTDLAVLIIKNSFKKAKKDQFLDEIHQLLVENNVILDEMMLEIEETGAILGKKQAKKAVFGSFF